MDPEVINCDCESDIADRCKWVVYPFYCHVAKNVGHKHQRKVSLSQSESVNGSLERKWKKISRSGCVQDDVFFIEIQ